jgi:hypothetical protein
MSRGRPAAPCGQSGSQATWFPCRARGARVRKMSNSSASSQRAGSRLASLTHRFTVVPAGSAATELGVGSRDPAERHEQGSPQPFLDRATSVGRASGELVGMRQEA